jgi:sortase A
MAERTGSRLNLSSLSNIERLALYGTILIWTGVIACAIGLAIALNNLRVEQIAYAEMATIAVTATETATPTPARQLYPAGWSTATPTPPRPPTATPAPTKRPGSEATRMPGAETSSGAIDLLDAHTEATPAPTVGPSPSLFPPDRLVIPSIDLDSPVVPIGWTSVEQGDESTRVWAVADDVVGWHKTSAYPGGNGNIVLNGHHNIKGEVFRYLVDVKVGDRVLVYAKDQIHYYAVTEKHILKEKGEPVEIRRQNARWIGPAPEERVTMITCWPYTNNTHRLIAVAHPIETSPPKEIERAQEP